MCVYSTKKNEFKGNKRKKLNGRESEDDLIIKDLEMIRNCMNVLMYMRWVLPK